VATEQRWRVDELAELTGTSVDTIRFYQKRRLLDPPRRDGRIAWYGPEHRERLARIRELRLRGLTLALIGRLVRGELDASDAPLAAAVAAADTGDEAEEFLTLEELAARTNLPEELLRTVTVEGLLVPRVHEGEDRYTASDADVIAAGLALLGTGLPMDAVLGLAREHHARTRATAEEAVALFDTHIRAPMRASDLPDDEKAQRLVDAFRVMLPAVTDLVEHHFRRVLLAVAQEHLESVGDATEIAAVAVEATRRIEGGGGAR
jgi:DNA-binding transcriptional MerR regulator